MQRIFCVAALFLAGCSSPAIGFIFPFSQELTVVAGTTVIVTEGVTVHFIGVSGDSRCPGDAICIQGGDAVVKLQVTSASPPRDVELHTGSMQPATSGDLTIELLQLMPYPFSSLPPIKPGDYRATIRLSR